MINAIAVALLVVAAPHAPTAAASARAANTWAISLADLSTVAQSYRARTTGLTVTAAG